MSHYALPILLYHRIVNDQSILGKHKIYVHEKKVRKQMQFLKEEGYQTITFQDVHKHTSFEKKIIITLDDGYEDNYTLLFPILKEFGFKAVIYLVTRQTHNAWALAEGEPKLSLLSHPMIKEMAAYGIEFGGHTCHHVDLKNTPEEKIKEEIADCKKDVESITQTPCISFAYPFGAHHKDVEKTVKEAGYSYGITTLFGPEKMNEDLMRIKRIEIRPSDSLTRFKYKASGYYFQQSYLKHLLLK
jgi:peptidoglycan/xylan/chitin deacetylase (PgdA/CDA1 family)